MISQDNETIELSGVWQDAIDTSACLTALPDADDTSSQRYGFRVGGIGFLIAQEELGEVAMDYAVHPIPNTEKWFIGMINMRGNLVPVFDIRMLLGIDNNTDDKDKRKLLILGSGEKAVGILIDQLPVTVNPDQTETDLPPLADVITNYVGSAFNDEGKVWVELDVDAFFESIGETMSAGQCQQ